MGADVSLEELLDYINQGLPLHPGGDMHLLMEHYSSEARKITARINSGWMPDNESRKLMGELTGETIKPGFRLFPPFYTDFGKNIHFGKNVFVNSCCCFQDQGGIFIGDNTLIGHQTVIATINHGLKPADRGTCYCKPVHIGKNVWIGANVKILPGISVGDNAILGAGAVVTKDVRPNEIVAGVPASHLGEVPAD